MKEWSGVVVMEEESQTFSAFGDDALCRPRLFLVHTMICWNFRSFANEYGLQKAQAADTLSKLF